MWYVTYKNKPATLEKICNVEGRSDITERMEQSQRDKVPAYRTRSGAISLYLYYIGFTWKERAKGIEVAKL